MKIRLGRSADLEAIVAIDPIAQADAARRRFLEAALQSGECWIAEPADSPVGFVILQYSFYGNGFVPLLAIVGSARRQGLGRTLLEHAASLCTTSKLFTSTNESNAVMRSLLPGLGFEPSGVIHNLDVDDPELVYIRRLQR